MEISRDLPSSLQMWSGSRPPWTSRMARADCASGGHGGKWPSVDQTSSFKIALPLAETKRNPCLHSPSLVALMGIADTSHPCLPAFSILFAAFIPSSAVITAGEARGYFTSSLPLLTARSLFCHPSDPHLLGAHGTGSSGQTIFLGSPG